MATPSSILNTYQTYLLFCSFIVALLGNVMSAFSGKEVHGDGVETPSTTGCPPNNNKSSSSKQKPPTRLKGNVPGEEALREQRAKRLVQHREWAIDTALEQVPWLDA